MHADPSSEKRSRRFYVPRDECFSEIKQLTFSAKTLYSVLHALSPSLATVMVDRDLGFPYFTAIDALFSQGVDLPPIGTEGFLQRVMPRVVKTLKDSGKGVLRFEAPETVNSTYDNKKLTHAYNTDRDTSIMYLCFFDYYCYMMNTELYAGDKFFWFRDEEFARQTLSGLNPCSLRLITVRGRIFWKYN